MCADSHARLALSTWRDLEGLVKDSGSTAVPIDGESLSIAHLVAISCYGHKAKIDDSPAAMSRVNDCVTYLAQLLDQDQVIYGVNTGFGGSANTRTADAGALQTALMQMQQCGILSGYQSGIMSSIPHSVTDATSMPETWVRAAMVVRCNTLVRGHSAVRHQTIQMLELLLNEDYTPLTPLRGSISASGDLSPLSYIAGVLEGNPKIFLWTGRDRCRTLVNASQALKQLQINPVSFGPKEALGMINGTAVSAAVAALALNEVHQLAVLSQILTAMAVEALGGTAESFHPFLSHVRPHVGQAEAANNILGFLRGSKLSKEQISSASLTHANDIYQDRYPLRTSTQWIGPLLEDLVLAHNQITTELNSTTDNPVIDVQTARVFHSGNFQAVAVTSAMDKTRSALQMLGKMLFAQCTEIMNENMNNGLPPNLVFDEPSVSYSFKGIDIAIAAYTSELGFLAHPVGPHVQSAEMANQAINSLALLSARYTHTAIDTFSMLAASYMYSLCQALDLRVIQVQYLGKLHLPLQGMTEDLFAAALPKESLDELQSLVWTHVINQFKATTAEDSIVRFQHIAESTQAVFLTFLTKSSHLPIVSLLVGISAIPKWTTDASALMRKLFDWSRQTALTKCATSTYLGNASKRIYKHIRVKMGIPLNRGLLDHPSVTGVNPANENLGDGQLIGECVSRIYDSLRSGEFMDTMAECLADVATYDASTNGTSKPVNGTDKAVYSDSDVHM